MASKKSPSKQESGNFDYRRFFFMAMKELRSETEHLFGIIMEKDTFEKICFEKERVLRNWVGVAFKEDEEQILKSLKTEKDRHVFLNKWGTDLTLGGLRVSTVCHKNFRVLIPKAWNDKEVSKLESFYETLKTENYKVDLGLLFKECRCT